MVALVAFAWFGITVKLGPRTLFQHLRAIGQTKESQDLVDGTRHAAEPLVDGVRRRIAGGTGAGDAPSPMAPDAGPPQERLSSSDQHQLRRLIRSRERSGSAP